MQVFESRIDGKHVVVLYEADNKPCHLYVKLEQFDVVRLDDTFPNAMKLSAFLACELLYGHAVDFLHDHGVPKESQLWHLNHSGWCPDMRAKVASPDALPRM